MMQRTRLFSLSLFVRSLALCALSRSLMFACHSLHAVSHLLTHPIQVWLLQPIDIISPIYPAMQIFLWGTSEPNMHG